jgi:hypothetical protein
MPEPSAPEWLPFEPAGLNAGRAFNVLRSFVQNMHEAHGRPADEREFLLNAARKRAFAEGAACEAESRQPLYTSVWLLTDLVRQGWDVRVRDACVELCRLSFERDDSGQGRDRIRERLHAAREEQLRELPVQTFIRALETRRLYGAHFVSIFSLMRDGAELARKLYAVRDGHLGLHTVIRPYLQFVDGDERCEHTGLRLADIWRYFRHTWSTPYQSIPGRSMMILVRDGAAPFHPVIGLAAVSSAAVAITSRDEAIGWTPEALVAILATRRGNAFRWILRTIDRSIARLYRVDLLRDEVVRLRELNSPTAATVTRLRRDAAAQRIQHHRFMAGQDYKRSARGAATDWAAQAMTPLFRSKRADELADLLLLRAVFKEAAYSHQSKASFASFASSSRGRKALSSLLKRIKADKVGSAISELTVCGALPPYADILGGKLVAMLMTSPQVRLEYRRRYGKSESVIASSMAGRPVVKSADLVFIGTTSLYGQRPNQYDRITVACGNGKDTIRYEYLGRTSGVGTFQFSERTVRQLELLLAHSRTGTRVNSVFGEGVNPRLRKIRGALDLLGLPTEDLLHHGTPRLVYGVRLARNLREYLLGVAPRPDYFFSDRDPATVTERIAHWWATRWLVKRVHRKDVLERVEHHTLIHPIRHGARVPRLLDPQQTGLFEAW